MKRKVTLVFHDEDLYTRLKIEVVRRHTTASNIVAVAVEEWLESHEDAGLLAVIDSARATWKEKGSPGQSVYEVEISPAADRDLDKLKGPIRMQDFERLRNVVGSLAENPRPQGVRKIEGAEKAYRIKVANYRLVYDVYDGDNLVLILQIARSSETTYRQLP